MVDVDLTSVLRITLYLDELGLFLPSFMRYIVVVYVLIKTLSSIYDPGVLEKNVVLVFID